ncbi:hypothetical protein IH979_03380 [Patescibacteria group bacterium]|nr:hypothetical protein [Patescibacteria group bacterium]
MPDYIEILRTAFIDLWAVIMLFLPKLLLAIIVFLLGLLVANLLNTAIMRIIRMLKIDDLVEKLEVKSMFLKMGIRLDVAALLGWIVKWFIIIVALIAAADVLEWDQLTAFLSEVVAYIPNVLVAVIILLVGIILANFVQGVVRSSIEAAKMESANFVAGVARWAIIVFSFMAALVQLGIAQSLIQVLFTGFVAMLALAGGLAFGLGGREQASRALEQLKRDLSSRK